jgi:hypothetical protein
MTTPKTLLTQGLLEAARRDGPDPVRKSRMWEAVLSAPEVSIAAGATGITATATAGKTVGGLSAGKLLLLGAFVGSVATAGLGTLAVRSLRAPPAVQAVAAKPALVDPSGAPSPALPAVEAPIEIAATPGMSPVANPAQEPPETAVAPVHARKVAPGPSREDSLLREAALVGEARSQIALGQPASALTLLDAAAMGPSHNLEPETLVLRVRALRSLGRDREAEQVETTLKRRYPEHFLAR